MAESSNRYHSRTFDRLVGGAKQATGEAEHLEKKSDLTGGISR